MIEKKFTTLVLAETAIFAAIAFVLDYLQGVIFDLTALFPNGGSIGIAMLPIIIIAIRRGVFAGTLCGFVTCLLQMMTGFYAISDTWYNVLLQVLLDYGITYAMTGLLAGVMSKVIKDEKQINKRLIFVSIATLLGGLGKFLCHFLAGCIFWKTYTYGAPWVYSLLYNGSYMLPSTVLCIVIMVVLLLKQPKLILPNRVGEES